MPCVATIQSSDNQNTKESSKKRARKGEKANTGPKFSAEASAKSVKKKLGPSHKFLGASPPLSRSASVSSVPPSTVSTTSSKSLNSLPPSMKSLVQAAKVRFRLHIATTSGFPDLNESVTTPKKLLQDICEERDAEKEWERFKENRSIALWVISLITQCRSNLRNKLRKTAQGMVANHFGLSLQMGELELADRVAKLKRNYSYIYAEPLNQNSKAPIFEGMENAASTKRGTYTSTKDSRASKLRRYLFDNPPGSRRYFPPVIFVACSRCAWARRNPVDSENLDFHRPDSNVFLTKLIVRLPGSDVCRSDAVIFRAGLIIDCSDLNACSAGLDTQRPDSDVCFTHWDVCRALDVYNADSATQLGF
ncbi:hypothetical protein FRC03_004332 [Tulasnella sp. 419]|nr:hypothetical protein FRC03_004332 [Tulasnella sp. 419]